VESAEAAIRKQEMEAMKAKKKHSSWKRNLLK